MLISLLPSVNETKENGSFLLDLTKLDSIVQLGELLTDLEKDDTLRISPSFLKETETHFIIENLKGVSGLILDIDDGMTLENAIRVFTKLGLEALFYTTHSHTEEENRFRIVCPFNKPISYLQYKVFTKGFKASKLFKLLEIDVTSLDSGKVFILPPKNSKITYISGKYFNPKPYYVSGKKIISDQAFKKMKSEILSTYDDDAPKPFKYFEVIVNNNSNEFEKGNRDRWLNKMIWILKKNGCEEEDMHLLLDDYIGQMSLSERRKFNVKIRN